MKNTNIGIVNLVVSNNLKDSYFNHTLIEESKKITTDFFDVVKSSPILQLEFKVFSNLENKTIENELTAIRYIDNNIRLFEVYTIDEIDAEREKLKPFISETKLPIDGDKMKLYYAIDCLINESLSNYDKIDVDVVHESFETVLNHIKSPKVQPLVETVEHKEINEDVIEIAITKFNEKYETLNESDKTLLKRLIKSTSKEKQDLLEEYKTDCLTILEGMNNENIEDKIMQTVRKIREMKHSSKTVTDDILGLHELKKGLL